MSKSEVTLIFVFLTGCALLGIKETRRPANYGGSTDAKSYYEEYDNKNYGAEIDPHQYLSFDRLIEILQREKLSTVSEALSYLNAHFREYLRFHTLVYESLSIQPASFDEPRALVFGPEARFIFSFNGGVHREGGNAFETMEYDSAKRQFHFREVVFKQENPHYETDLLPEEIQYQDERILVSTSNPGKCARCHGKTGIPIFETYFLWPGFYGSHDDFLTQSFDFEEPKENSNMDFFQAQKSGHPRSLGRLFDVASSADDVEAIAYMKYLKAQKSHPRYKFLPERIVDEPFRRFMAGEKFQDLNYRERFNLESDRLKAVYIWPARPNLFLQHSLEHWNQERIIAAIESKSSSEILKNIKWSQLLDGDFPLSENVVRSFNAVVPQKVRNTLAKNHGPFEKFFKELLIKEIHMQMEKMDNSERVFGKGKLKRTPNEDRNTYRFGMEWTDLPAIKFYEKLLKRKLKGFAELMAVEAEVDNLAKMAVIAYVLRGVGINLEDYALNVRRVITFNSTGFEEVRNYLRAKFTQK